MVANTALIRVGSLLEIRADAGYRTASDVDQLFDQVTVEVRRLPPPARHVTVVDWRRCPVMAPAAAERMAKRIAGVNAHTLRSAALAGTESPSAVLQFVRLIREARLPDRKLFFEPGELVEWLGEVLTSLEMTRLREFIAGAK
jgi:hypothetical protein